MTARRDIQGQQRWARLAGLMLVLTNATAMFAVGMRGSFVVRNDPAATAAALAADEILFRTALAFDLITIAGVIPLIAGLYVVLKPVGPNLARLALLWWLVENAVLAAVAFASFGAITLATGGGYLRGLDPAQTADLVYTLLRVHAWGFQFGFLFLGLGQLVFSWLWWKSRYVPRPLAGLGLFASSVMAAMAVGIIVWPPLYGMATMAYMAPMGLYEMGLGLWLVICGIRLPAAA